MARDPRIVSKWGPSPLIYFDDKILDMSIGGFFGWKPRQEILPPLIANTEEGLRSLLNQTEREIRDYLKTLSHDDLHALKDRLHKIDFSHVPPPQDHLMRQKRDGVIVGIKLLKQYY